VTNRLASTACKIMGYASQAPLEGGNKMAPLLRLACRAPDQGIIVCGGVQRACCSVQTQEQTSSELRFAPHAVIMLSRELNLHASIPLWGHSTSARRGQSCSVPGAAGTVFPLSIILLFV